MVFGYAAKARRQHVLHVKTRIGRQDDFLVVITQLLVTESAVVTRDAVLTAGHVGALMLRNRRSGVERDRVPNYLCTALPHIMRKGKGAADVCSHNLEATIGSATARKPEIVQKHRHCNQFCIRSVELTRFRGHPIVGGGKERPRCRRAIGRTRRSSDSASSNWCGRDVRRKNWGASSNPQPSRSGIGFGRPTVMMVGARTG